MAPSAPTESEEETQQRQAEYEHQQREYEAERERENEERRQQFQREHEEMEAEAARRDEVRKQREATFDRIVANAPATLTAPQLRVILRAIVNLDPYTFADDLAENIDEENEQRSTEEVLLAAIDRTADEKLTGFAVHLALAGHRDIPRENEFDFLTEAEAAFAPKEPKKTHRAPEAETAHAHKAETRYVQAEESDRSHKQGEQEKSCLIVQGLATAPAFALGKPGQDRWEKPLRFLPDPHPAQQGRSSPHPP